MLSLAYMLALKARRSYLWATHTVIPGVRAIVIKDDSIVLVQHRGGIRPWGLPGGGVGRRETLDNAVLREVREETGCITRIESLHGIFLGSLRGKQTYLAVFICTPITDPQPPVNDIEIATACYVPLRSLPVTTDIETRCAIADYLCGETNIVRTLPIKER